MSKYFNNRKINEFNKLFYTIIFIFILQIIKSEEQIECPRDKPILISGKCEPNCTNLSQCLVANPIIQTQWLNNIRIIGELKYRYINFASYPNNDMIVETTCYPASNRRILYGLKADGTPYFTNRTTQQKTPFYIIDIIGSEKGKFEADGLIIKTSGTVLNSLDGNEYFMSVSKLDCYAEIFNFDTNIVYSKSVSSFTAIQDVKSLRNAFIPLKSSNYYLFGFIGCASNSNDDKIYFQKHKFPRILTTFPSIITYETNSYIPRPNGYYNYNFINIENAYGYEVSFVFL